MPYINLTLEVGVFVNAYRVLCNCTDKFSNIVLHLGDFHLMKEVFTLIGKLVTASGFEDIIFQSGICSTGSFNRVLSGSHYNRGWAVHTVVSEALERLSLQCFIDSGVEIPERFFDRIQLEQIRMEELKHDEEFIKFQNDYNDFKEGMRIGSQGKRLCFGLCIT